MPVVVARRFKTNPNGEAQTVQELVKGAKFLGRVLHTKFPSALPFGLFDEGFVLILSDIYYPDNSLGRILQVGHGWSVSFGEC